MIPSENPQRKKVSKYRNNIQLIPFLNLNVAKFQSIMQRWMKSWQQVFILRIGKQ